MTVLPESKSIGRRSFGSLMTAYGRNSLRSLKHVRLRWYFAGVAVSLLGTFLQLTLLRWAAYEFTNSTTNLGLLSLCSLIPNAVLAIPAGLFVSGRNKRNILIATQMCAALPAACFALLAHTHSLNTAWLLSLSFFLGCIIPFETAARFPLMSECVKGEPPFNAFSLSALVFYLSRCAGPLLGSAVLGLFSISTGFLLNLASYFVEIVTLWRMGPGGPSPPCGKPNFREVVRFCGRLENGFLLAGVAIVSFLGVQLQLMPALADKLYSSGSTGFALLIAANELGAVGAALWLTTRDDSFSQSRVIRPSMMTMSGSLLAFCFSHWLSLGLLSMFIVGLSQGLLITASQNVLQGRADNKLKAPLASIFWAGFFCCQGIGASALSLFAEAWSVRSVFIVAAVTLFLVALIGRPRIPRP